VTLSTLRHLRSRLRRGLAFGRGHRGALNEIWLTEALRELAYKHREIFRNPLLSFVLPIDSRARASFPGAPSTWGRNR